MVLCNVIYTGVDQSSHARDTFPQIVAHPAPVRRVNPHPPPSPHPRAPDLRQICLPCGKERSFSRAETEVDLQRHPVQRGESRCLRTHPNKAICYLLSTLDAGVVDHCRDRTVGVDR
jgi:hypothetical protein